MAPLGLNLEPKVRGKIKFPERTAGIPAICFAVARWTPYIVPSHDCVDQDVYLVVDDFGPNGQAWREADVQNTDLETVILDMLEGQYKTPVRAVAFSTSEKWSQDMSADVAHELRQRCDLQARDVPFFLQDFVDHHEGR
jgi:hypothetical protein